MEITLLSIWYISCCIMAYGLNFAYFIREYPIIYSPNNSLYQHLVSRNLKPDNWLGERKKMTLACAFMSIAGPISILIVILTDGVKHGFKFRLRGD